MTDPKLKAGKKYIINVKEKAHIQTLQETEIIILYKTLDIVNVLRRDSLAIENAVGELIRVNIPKNVIQEL